MGQDLPVNLRILAPYSTLEQHGGDPAWKGIATGWLGAGVWNAGKDGLFAFTALADRPDLRPGVGGWLRIGDEVTFWLPIEQDAEGRTVATEINGTIDLGRSPRS